MFEAEPLQQIDRTYVLWKRRKLSYFSGCDYFRLSSHAQIRSALVAGLKRYGLNVAASRATSGNHELYLDLEEQLARSFKAPAALLVPSGYVADLAVAQGLAGQFSHALVDETAHPALKDAAAALECPVLTFRHRSSGSLAASVARCGKESKPLVLTDGLFSRDGTVAPLKEYLAALPRDGMVLVDDAHGAGVLGPNGRGSLEHNEVSRTRVIQTITLSKAFGVYGGAILGSRALRRKIVTRSQLFVGSTPLPLPLTNAALQAVRLLESGRTFRSRLFQNAGAVKGALANKGIRIPEAPGPIIALMPKTAVATAKMKSALLRAGIYPPLIHYHGPVAGYFRFVISSEHAPSQLENLAQALIRCGHLFVPLGSASPGDESTAKAE